MKIKTLNEVAKYKPKWELIKEKDNKLIYQDKYFEAEFLRHQSGEVWEITVTFGHDEILCSASFDPKPAEMIPSILKVVGEALEDTRKNLDRVNIYDLYLLIYGGYTSKRDWLRRKFDDYLRARLK